MANRGSEGFRGFLQPSQLVWKLSDAARQFRERKTMSPEAALGKRGEDLAHRYLIRAGMPVLARNYRPGGGEVEIDIVARDGDKTVFVEVKSRATAEYGTPERAVGQEKQTNIVRAARGYATRAGLDWSQVRFDIVTVVFEPSLSIVHLQDAFSPRPRH
jgi:putative endonuclease